jgi:hypothetical protein
VPEKEGDAAKKAPPKAEPKSPWDDESDALDPRTKINDQGSDNSNSADDRTKEIKNAVEDAYFEKAFEVTPEGVARKLPPRRPAQEKWGKTTQSARDKDAKQVREARQEVRESTSGSKSGNIPKSIGQKIRRQATQSYIRGRKATDVGDRGVGEATQRMKRSAEAGRNFSQVNAPAGTKWGEPYIKNAIQDAWFEKAGKEGSGDTVADREHRSRMNIWWQGHPKGFAQPKHGESYADWETRSQVDDSAKKPESQE